MNHFETRAYQQSFRKFARIEHWLAPHAVTLTLRQGMAVPNGAADTFVLLTRESAIQNYRHFLNLLGFMALGQAAKRFGRRINSISTIEGGKGKRLHIHAVIDCPPRVLMSPIGRFPIPFSTASSPMPATSFQCGP